MQKETLVQAMLASHTLDAAVLEKLVEKTALVDAEYGISDQKDFKQCLLLANQALAPLSMRIVRACDHYTSSYKYVLVTTDGSSIGSPLGKSELLHFRDMLAVFFASDRCRPASLNELCAGKSPEKTEALLDLLADENYIHHTGGTYRLGLRTLLELGPYLESMFLGKTLFKCAGCKQLMVYGLLCASNECTTRVHQACAGNYARLMGLERGKCFCGDTFDMC